MIIEAELQKQIDKYDASKGRDVAQTNLGMAMITYIFLLTNREGFSIIDREQVFFWAIEVMMGYKMGCYTYSDNAMRDKIIDRCVKKYESPKKVDKRKLKKKIDEDEYAGVFWLCKLFADASSEDRKEFVKIDRDMIEVWMRENFPKNTPHLIMQARDPEDRVFKDPQVDYFYQQMKINYLNYYKVFEKMGIGEAKMEKLIEMEEYKEAYKRAQKVIDMEVVSQSIKKAKEGDNPSINGYLKRKGVRDDEDDEKNAPDEWSSNMFADHEPVERKPREYNEDLDLEKPEDNPVFDQNKDLSTDQEFQDVNLPKNE